MHAPDPFYTEIAEPTEDPGDVQEHDVEARDSQASSSQPSSPERGPTESNSVMHGVLASRYPPSPKQGPAPHADTSERHQKQVADLETQRKEASSQNARSRGRDRKADGTVAV